MRYKVVNTFDNPAPGTTILDPDLPNCLPTSTAAVQTEDVCPTFLFVCDLHGHH